MQKEKSAFSFDEIDRACRQLFERITHSNALTMRWPHSDAFPGDGNGSMYVGAHRIWLTAKFAFCAVNRRRMTFTSTSILNQPLSCVPSGIIATTCSYR